MISRNERMKQVERYVSQAMSTEERETFRARLERDSDLRRMVDTEQFVIQTLRRDRDKVPTDHDRTRARVLTVLASLGAGPAAVQSAQAEHGASTAHSAVNGTTAANTAATVNTSSAVGSSTAATASSLVAVGGMSVIKTILLVVASGVVLTSAWFIADQRVSDESTPAAIEQHAAPSPDTRMTPTDSPVTLGMEQVREDTAPAQNAAASVPSASKDVTLKQAPRGDKRSGLMVEPTSAEATNDTLRMKLQVTLPK